MAATTGIVLLAHGSRDARWREPVEAVARRMREREDAARVTCAYLELAKPDLRAAATELIASGARSIRVVPLFLGMGKHIREDLPRLLDELRALHPTTTFSVKPAVGEEPMVIDLLARIALER